MEHRAAELDWWCAAATRTGWRGTEVGFRQRGCEASFYAVFVPSSARGEAFPAGGPVGPRRSLVVLIERGTRSARESREDVCYRVPSWPAGRQCDTETGHGGIDAVCTELLVPGNNYGVAHQYPGR